MKKVLFITTISGFLPQFEKNDVKILQEMGCEIHYASNFKNPIYTFDEEELKGQGILLHHIDIAKSPVKVRTNVNSVRQLKAIIDGNEIDMIHCHNPMGGVVGRVAAARSRRRPYVIYTAHGFHFYQGAPLLNWLLFYPAERALSHVTDQIITINREDYLLAKSFPLRKNGSVTQVHSVGVDKERFQANKSISEIKRKELGIPEDAFHIVTAAELNKNKNQRVVIEAISQLENKDIHYSICGKGPGEGGLKRLIAEKQLENQVHLLGYRTDMEEVLQTADCFAFPSHREGLGVAAIEALLCEVPIIVSDNRGTREYAQNGSNSIVCGAHSIQDFKEAIHLLYTDREKRSLMISHCRQSAEKFTVEEVEKTMKEVYERWINQ